MKTKQGGKVDGKLFALYSDDAQRAEMIDWWADKIKKDSKRTSPELMKVVRKTDGMTRQ